MSPRPTSFPPSPMPMVSVVSVERAGRNEKNVYHTAFGHDMSRWTSKIDHMLDEARDRGILTIGIEELGERGRLRRY